MEDYLEKLKNQIEKKNIKSFWVFTEYDEFKPLKKTKKDIIEKLKKYPKKYGSQNIANVTLTVRINGLKKNDWIFAIKIDIYEIDENGLINQSPNDTWSLLLKYNSDELTERPFNMDDIENMISIVNEKLILTSMDGIHYSNFLKKIKKLKNKIK
jgi:hypothetical protein